MCKYALLIIGVGVLVQFQTAKCELANGNIRILTNRIRNTESEFLTQNNVGTQTPIESRNIKTEFPFQNSSNTEPIESAIIVTEFPHQNSTETEPLVENTTDAGSSIPTTKVAAPPIRKNAAFEDLDDKSSHLYKSLIDIFNASRKLSEELNQVITRGNKNSKAVLFLGRAGSGKTTLAQILDGSINRLQAKELIEDSGEYRYYIDDGFIRDNQTGVTFSDHIGFQDTADAYVDIAIALSVKIVAESFKYIKIALVCPHSSLRKGAHRSEFTNFLERIVDIFKDSEHLISGITLIVTKVENSYSIRNGQTGLVSDSAELQAIGSFLNEIRLSYIYNSSNCSTPDRPRLIAKILQNLLSKRSGKFQRIKILRSPGESGPIINQTLIMEERESIRHMLLSDKGFEPVSKDSIGVAISTRTRDSINTLFRKLDSYIVGYMEEFGRFLKDNFLIKIGSDDDDITIVVPKRKKDLDIIQSLRSQIGKCHNPENVVDVVNSHMKSQNLTYDRTKLQNILTRYEILKTVEYLSTKNYLLSKNWQNALNIAEKAINEEFLYQSMLADVFLILRDYKIEKDETFILGNDSVETDPELQIDPKDIIHKLNLTKYACLEFNKQKVEEFNQIVMRSFTRNQKNVRCEKNMLIIIDSFIFISKIQEELASCVNVDSIVLLAADTVIIDSDLSHQLEGRHLMIVAPIWMVYGRRYFVLDGKPHEKKLPKASLGQVGLDGKDGNPSGNFMGIGLTFHNIESLIVNACGGNGQDGQDGGDGKDETDGVDEGVDVGRDAMMQLSKTHDLERSEARKEGQLGSVGLNSGAGGQGGKGGAEGSITIIDLESHGQPHANNRYHVHTIECQGQQGLTGADGKPGNSGSNGCSSIETTKTHKNFGEELYSNTETERLPCTRLTAEGEVIRQRRVNPYVPSQRSPLPSVCEMYGRLRLYINDNPFYISRIIKRLIDEFQKAVGKLCR